MYNRYIRNDDGIYTRQAQQEQEQQKTAAASQTPPPSPPPNTSHRPPEVPKPNGQIPIFSGILDRLHLGDIDIGDLLLLLLLFHLFREDGDEELLIAIGLLLIL